MGKGRDARRRFRKTRNADYAERKVEEIQEKFSDLVESTGPLVAENVRLSKTAAKLKEDRDEVQSAFDQMVALELAAQQRAGAEGKEVQGLQEQLKWATNLIAEAGRKAKDLEKELADRSEQVLRMQVRLNEANGRVMVLNDRVVLAERAVDTAREMLKASQARVAQLEVQLTAATYRVSGGKMPLDTWRRVLKLIHPDYHSKERAAEANEVTKLVIALKP